MLMKKKFGRPGCKKSLKLDNSDPAENSAKRRKTIEVNVTSSIISRSSKGRLN